MRILVINCGSSSIKGAIINSKSRETELKLDIERVNDNPRMELNGKPIECQGKGHEQLLQQAFSLLREYDISGIGHRVVHGGAFFDRSVVIDDNVKSKIDSLSSLAPLHNPMNLMGIKEAEKAFPALPQLAVFDTSFHHTLPNRAKTYPLPKELRQKHGLKRYGFHGTSHKYVAMVASEIIGQNWRELRIISCHLGNGASVTAVEYGRSVETSMGMTPLEGLVMGTRSGDIDAGLLMYLMRHEGLSIDDTDHLLNKESGLKALSGAGSDMRDIIDKASAGDEDSRMALQVFTHRLRKYIGAYAAIMGGVDAIVFTGGIGENSSVIRHRATQRLEFLGALLDEEKNMDINLSDAKNAQLFSLPHSRVKLLAVRTNEQLAIARESASLIKEKNKVNTVTNIPIAVSARHIHLRKETLDVLFGPGYQLTQKAALSQPGQFAANECLTLVGPKNSIENVRILGPCRSKDQIEISRTDEFFLGIDAPVRASGHTENSPGIKLIGPKGNITLKEGVICAWRHIHMHPDDASQFGVDDKDIVDIQVNNELRPLTFGNVLVRVSPKYKLEMHIDTDEGNAAELPRHSEGVLISTEANASLIRRWTKINKV